MEKIPFQLTKTAIQTCILGDKKGQSLSITEKIILIDGAITFLGSMKKETVLPYSL